jgi:hypothetical protein
MRSRFASTMGAIPDLMNLKRSLLPAEAVQALEAEPNSLQILLLWWNAAMG